MSPASMQEELQFLSTLPYHWFIKLGMALFCGAIIGFEREMRKKAAGIRTNVMICIGSTLYMLLSELIMANHPTPAGDYTRIAGQVVVGMGFIGAGAIIQSRGRVIGLTSAATMWVVAAIGLIIGAGYPLFGLIVTVFVVGLLVGVGKLEVIMMGKCKFVTTEVSFRDDPQTWNLIREIFEAHNKKIEDCHLTRNKGVCFLEVTYCSDHGEHKEFFVELLGVHDIRQSTRPFMEPSA